MTAHEPFDDRDGPRDECGVFGIYAPEHDVARLAYFALYALQHRGQESAGIAAADHGGYIITQRALGLVSQVFKEHDLRALRRRPGDRPRPLLDHRLQRVGELPARPPLRGRAATAASSRWPTTATSSTPSSCTPSCASAGVTFRSTSDSEIIAALLADAPGRRHRGRDRRRDAAPAGRLLDGRHDQGPRLRLPRSRRACARSSLGPARRPLLRRLASRARSTSSAPSCLRDVQPGELVSHRRGRHPHAPGRRGRARGVLRLRVHLLRAARLAHGRRRPAGRARAHGRDPRARGAGAERRPRHRRARTPATPPRAASRAPAACRRTTGSSRTATSRGRSSSPARSCASTACG